EERLGVALQLAEDLGGDLLRRPLLAVDVEAPVLLAHVTFDGPDRPVRVRDGLALGDLAHQDLAGLGESHHRGGDPLALRVGDDRRLPALQHGDHRVRGAQVDSDRSGHETVPPRSGFLESERRIGVEYSIVKVERPFAGFWLLTLDSTPLWSEPSSSSSPGWPRSPCSPCVPGCSIRWCGWASR